MLAITLLVRPSKRRAPQPTRWCSSQRKNISVCEAWIGEPRMCPG